MENESNPPNPPIYYRAVKKATKGELCKEHIKWNNCTHEEKFEQGPCKYAHTIDEVRIFKWKQF
jgi:hypothetical protein